MTRASKRTFDLTVVILFAPFLIFAAGIISAGILLIDGRPTIYISTRVGAGKTTFKMYKFRTMSTGTPQVQSDNLKDPASYMTRSGGFLRKFSLDEIPQFFNVMLGDMSLVGPRPALPSQHQLLKYRSDLGIDSCLPGISGLAQINGRDDLSEKDKAYFDSIYCKKSGMLIDLVIMSKTVINCVVGKNISH